MKEQDYNHRFGGLVHKYTITKSDGTPCAPEAEYFVLRIDKDPHALVALEAYAESIKDVNPEFYRGLTRKISAIKRPQYTRPEK